MKIIPKRQKGGSFDAFFTTYMPVQTETPKQTSSSQRSTGSTGQSSEKGKLTEKDFFDMIKDIDGLPNEMNNIVMNLINTFQLSNLTGADPGDLATTYLSNLYQIKIAAQNKKKYDQALDNASKNGALAEPAISMDGKLIVQNDDGSVQTISLSEYNSNRDKYSERVLTVSNLANMRQYDPSLINDQSIFSIINNSMGFESFQELLKQAITSIGESEMTRSGVFTNAGQASKGLSLLQSLKDDERVSNLTNITAEGLYEYKIIDKNQLNQINELTSYITTLIPERAKTWAAFKMGQDDKDQATRDLVVAYLLGQSKNSNSLHVQYKGSLDKVQGTGTKSNKDSEMTFLTALQQGYGGERETNSLNFGNNTSFNVTGTAYGATQGIDGKIITNATLSDLLSQTGIQGITSTKSITFGDNLINSNALNKIAVENNGGFWAVLPCTKQGNIVTPNFTLMESFNTVVQEVIDETNENTSPEQKQELLEKKLQDKPELYELLNMSGNLDQSKFQAFYIVDGLASDRNFTFKNNNGSDVSGNSNPLIQPTDNQEDIDYFKSVTMEEDFDENSIWPGDWFSMYDTLYKSKIFIPIKTTNRLAAILFSGQKIGDTNARAIEGEYQRYENRNKMNTPSSKYLYE